jgi:FHA domain/FhaA, N-terminal domain
MSFARSVERLLESMVDRVAATVFPGALAPGDLAGRVIRAVDLEIVQGELGPEAPNVVEIRIHPADLDEAIGASVLGAALAGAFEDEAALRGWRLGGPADIRIETDAERAHGRPSIRTGRKAGPRPAWGRLVADRAEFPLTDNRLLVGRADTADVQVLDDSVSRSHCLVWREGGQVRVRDLGSANGTSLNGRRVTGDGVVDDGDELRFGEVATRMAIR